MLAIQISRETVVFIKAVARKTGKVVREALGKWFTSCISLLTWSLLRCVCDQI